MFLSHLCYYFSRIAKDVHGGLSNPPQLPNSSNLTAPSGVSTSSGWSDSIWAPRVQPPHQRDFEVRRAGLPSPTPFGLTLHLSPWGGNAGHAISSMPWTGMDTLSGVSQQSLLRGYEAASSGHDPRDGYEGCLDGLDGGFGGFDTRQLIPSAWEDFGGHGVVMSSRMLSQTQGLDHRYEPSAPLRNAFSPYEFRASARHDAEHSSQRPTQRAHSRDPSSFDHIFAEFSEKCSVREYHGRVSPRWMDTPTRRAVVGQHGEKEDGRVPSAERSRRRLNF